MAIMMMVGNDDDNVVEDDEAAEIVKDKISWEEKSAAPERIRHPGVQVIIIPRRRIIGHNRRTFAVIIVINHFGIGILAIVGRWFALRRRFASRLRLTIRRRFVLGYLPSRFRGNHQSEIG